MKKPTKKRANSFYVLMNEARECLVSISQTPAMSRTRQAARNVAKAICQQYDKKVHPVKVYLILASVFHRKQAQLEIGREAVQLLRAVKVDGLTARQQRLKDQIVKLWDKFQEKKV